MRLLACTLLLVACGSPTAAPPDCTADPECSDGVFCNGEETCDSYIGECVAGVPVQCADSVACTVDACDEAAQACTAVPDDARCGPRESCSANGCTIANECRDLDSGFGAPITIAGASTDTTVSLVVDTAALIAAGKLQADCDDLRVTHDGVAVPFWLDGCNTATSTLTVRVSDSPTSLILNYGNTTAGSLRNFNGTFSGSWDFEDNDLVGWTPGTVAYQAGIDGPGSSATTTAVKKTGNYALQLRADASCTTEPFDGAGVTVERAMTGSYCIDFDWRADITGFEFDTNAEMHVRVGTTSVGNTACSGQSCAATGTWTHATLGPLTSSTLSLQGFATDCADGNVYIDNVRIRACEAGVTASLGAELDCSAQ